MMARFGFPRMAATPAKRQPKRQSTWMLGAKFGWWSTLTVAVGLLTAPVAESFVAAPRRKGLVGRLGSGSYFEKHREEVLGRDGEDLPNLRQGTQEGFFVVQEYVALPSDQVSGHLTSLVGLLGDEKARRWDLQANNLTLPVALCMLDPSRYPTLSRARKECRQGKIVLEAKGEIPTQAGQGEASALRRGRVGDRVVPGLWIGRQEAKATILLHNQTAVSPFWTLAKPPFHLPVVYEDDHMAIVNKPTGTLVYAEGGKGRNNVRFALLHALKPPAPGTVGIRPRPEVVHRLDHATSGLLVVGKTLQATQKLSKQFEDRRVQKTYTAVVKGHPGAVEAGPGRGLVVDGDGVEWHLVYSPLEGKDAITLWRPLLTEPSADRGQWTMLELMPKTGRYHQLRRHMAWTYGTPIAGDPIYGKPAGEELASSSAIAESTKKEKRYHRGLLLCSNRILLEHPYYNTPEGRRVWKQGLAREQGPQNGSSSSVYYDQTEDLVRVEAAIDLPEKFHKFLRSQRRRAEHTLPEP